MHAVQCTQLPETLEGREGLVWHLAVDGRQALQPIESGQRRQRIQLQGRPGPSVARESPQLGLRRQRGDVMQQGPVLERQHLQRSPLTEPGQVADGGHAVQREVPEGLCVLQQGEVLRCDLLHEQHLQVGQRAQAMEQVLVHAVHPYPAQAGARGNALERLALAQLSGRPGRRAVGP
ncbi:MAG: hypothetical protein ABT02_01290 [Comamonadaceae bacterium SCN 68-20]|nr:MAG: hypothetical protein ABT02_01290 [Comamonadaceae bacterium SCN 68-20]OJX28877.1 MAG: hypothetical protein BGO75_08600 [Burkholderiales bacterium 68-20]